MKFKALLIAAFLMVPFESSLSQSNPDAEMEVFTSKLKACEKYSGKFVHPFVNESLSRTILGLDGGVCSYKEEMPKNGVMECKLSESQRIKIAEFYKMVSTAKKTSFSVSFSVMDGTSETKYEVDGVETANPIQEAMNARDCIVYMPAL